MRAFLVALATTAALGIGAPAGASAQSARMAQRALRSTLVKRLVQARGRSGGYVLDLNTGQVLFSSAPDVPRIPASVQKLYTTTTALLRFGPSATLTTSLLGQGTLDSLGDWNGTLYLRGAGDPTFGSASFDQSNYGAGATVQSLVGNLVAQTGVTTVHGAVVGDESYFDSLRGTPASGFSYSFWVEGSLSALAFNRGVLDGGHSYIPQPAVYAARQVVSALRAAHITVAKTVSAGAGTTPTTAQVLASVQSPTIAQLIWLTNAPSDNFFAEMLLKGLGARFGAGGTTAAGAAVVRSEMASQFGIAPRFNDGSGLSRSDATTPRQVVALLAKLAGNPYFVRSLAVAGETGTLQHEMRGTAAQARCRGKTGTLSDVASLTGYCRARDGHTLAFAFLMNSLRNPNFGHAVEANMAVALAKYNG
ncbi:MAG: D-alanyl-D-alanine carboxypeptidase/D-alanyl-D-alanine-endopeptidase [Solirubrobacterales bacterium]|nr:D-alanyl-D-alanine carboxypeptidase/D-alanyl-D-alanine-endopeptidase [Solirubrobacterales bacterium]MBV9714079.1 D-alanyl-D-alanine carboxypeptidase/D-alanyl-D-alanine-endopeptidase [Solirubrobacterales bacterium]